MSFKNHFKQVDYKERSQLRERSHLGLLEKAKDYKLRAKDYRTKQERLTKLRVKASLKNDDEYYKQMHKSHLNSRGRHIDFREDSTRSRVDRKNTKTQDLNYLTLKAQTEKAKLNKLRDSLQLLDEGVGAASGRKHVVFTESAEAVRSFDTAAHFGTAPELVDRAYNRVKLSQLEAGSIVVSHLGEDQGAALATADARTRASYGELALRRKRLREVERVSEELTTHAKLLDGGKRKKIVVRDEFGDEVKSRTQYKWKQERKR